MFMEYIIKENWTLSEPINICVSVEPIISSGPDSIEIHSKTLNLLAFVEAKLKTTRTFP